MFQKQKRLLAAILLLLLSFVGLVGIQGVSPIYAASCTSNSIPGWYPPTYSYNTSFLNLYGHTETCWQGSQFSQRGYSYGSQYPGTPLSRIRAVVLGWEETNGSQCTQTYVKDSNWKYGYSASANLPYRHWECTGSSSHNYVAQTSHLFGYSASALTGNK